MFKLEIKNADGSHYWTEYFETQEKMNEWLIEEKSRPYWDNNFTHSFKENKVDLTEIENRKIIELDKRNKRALRIANMKVLDWSKINTLAELKPILKVLVEDFLKDEQ